MIQFTWGAQTDRFHTINFILGAQTDSIVRIKITLSAQTDSFHKGVQMGSIPIVAHETRRIKLQIKKNLCILVLIYAS